MFGLNLTAILGVAGLLAVIGAFTFGFTKGKQIKQLEWDAARAVLLEEKAKAERQRDQAIADADIKERAAADEIDKANAENEDKLRDALARAANAGLGDTLFCVNDDIDRLFNKSVGSKHGSQAGDSPSPCKARVLPIPEASSEN